MSDLENTDISIRFMQYSDVPHISRAFQDAHWPKSNMLFESYLNEHQTKKRLIWVALYRGLFAGYVTLKWISEYQFFSNQLIPEIADLNVLPSYRNLGIGSCLLNRAEQAASTQCSFVGIGVGLYGGSDGGYGFAQRLYVKRGYIPDGKGVTYNYQYAIPHKQYPLDDDLILWFIKQL